MASNDDNFTWGAKVSLELKEEIGQLIKESGLTSKEFLEQLVSTHKTQLLQGNDADRHEEIQHVTYHLEKIKSSFVGLVEKGIDLSFKFKESLEQESVLHKAITDQQQLQIRQAGEEKDRAVLDRAELEKTMAGIVARNEELESNNKTHGITIQMQMAKLTELESRIGSVVELEQEVGRLKQESLLQVKHVEELERGLTDHKRLLEITQASSEAQSKDAIKATEQLVQVHQLELEKAVLETEKKLKDDYVSKVETLTAKNQELLERLHQLELVASSQAPQTKTKAKLVKDVITTATDPLAKADIKATSIKDKHEE